MKFKKIVIIGMGFIGGSIGKALLAEDIAEEVIGVCRRQVSLDKAVKEKALTSGMVDDHQRAVLGAEIVIIATPVHTVKDILDRLADVINNKDVIVTDVGSTKKEIVTHAAKYKDKFTFIGSHPMAGSEKTGVEHSSGDLFRGSVCIITPDDNTDKNKQGILNGLWTSIGAETVSISPDGHDRCLAFSSHLPHIAAYALAGILDENISHKMFSTGFKDTTRIAASDPKIWSDIFASNRENVLKALKKYKGIISDIENSISSGDADELEKKLSGYKRMRDELV
ncbi:MAG: prephenate dehydrogenase/arogenate dehydrogenase family protein [Candidatus Omnitrophota bacterium]|nr:prephenate dehydrogenase/arogenate dehydrogenase family protein [Candidatus Omnitrophota bacterium]